MKTRWLRQLLPRAWRDAVAGDLEEEARADAHGTAWLAWQVLRTALRLGWTFVAATVTTDARYAVRSVVRTPWFTAGAVLTFAVGFGVNLATFSVVDRILFRRAPYGDPSRLVVLRVCQPGTNTCFNDFPDLLWTIGEQRGLRTIGEQASASYSIRYDVDPTTDESPLSLATATPSVLRVLAVRPIWGRAPNDDEPHGDPDADTLSAVLSYETWQRRFGGSPAVLGRLVGRSPRFARIIGVLPADFIPPSPEAVGPTWDGLVFTDRTSIFAPVARLAAGATVSGAQAEVNALVTNFKATGSRARLGPVFVRVERIDRALFTTIADSAWLVVAVVALLFLMASVNLAALMVARGQSREREAALRRALGAGTARIVTTTVAESIVVCGAGAALAWVGLMLASSGLRSVLPPVFGRYASLPLDPHVVIFTLVVAAAMAIAVALSPALRVAGADVVTTLGQAATGPQAGTRLFGGRTLVAIEAALGVAVVLVAVLTTTSFSTLVETGTGYDTHALYQLSVAPAAAHRVTPLESLGRYRLELAAASGLPGVVAVAGGDSLPGTGAGPMNLFSKDPTQRGGRYELSAGALAAMGARLVAGREFTPGEVDAGAPVALVNEGGAAVVAPSIPAAALVGRMITLKDEGQRLVVGIAPNLRSRYGRPVEPAIFVPLGAQPDAHTEMLIRLAPGARPDLAAFRQRLGEAVGPVRVGLSSVAESVDVSLVEPRFRAVLFVAIAVCGLVLAAAGLYALTAFEVSRRTREMAIRVALGATDRRLYWFVTSDVLRPVLVGAAIGLVATFWAVKFIRLFLYQMDGREPGLYAVATVILVSTAAVTAWIPARRAARTDPATVLRVS